MQKRIDDFIKIVYERGPTTKIMQLYSRLSNICGVADVGILHTKWNEAVEKLAIDDWDLAFNEELINPSKYSVTMDESGFGTVTLRAEGKAINSMGAGNTHPMISTTGTTGAGR